MKSFQSILILLTIMAFSETVLALPETQNTYSSAIDKKESIVDTPICYMRTANGSVLDLSKLCEAKSENTGRIPVRRTINVYNYTRTNKFDRELYGD